MSLEANRGSRSPVDRRPGEVGQEQPSPSIGMGLRLSSALLLTSLALTTILPRSSAQQQNIPPALIQQTTRLSGQIRYNRISPPESGVKLIEEVFQRVRSTPQMAMKTNNIMQQAQALQPTQGGPTDYRLAIRPKPTGKTIIPSSPTLQILRPEAQANTIIAALGGGGGNFAGGSSGVKNMADKNADKDSAQGGASVSMDDGPAPVENWMGNRPFPAQASGQSTHPNVWEIAQKPAERKEPSEGDMFTPPSTPAPVPAAQVPASLGKTRHQIALNETSRRAGSGMDANVKGQLTDARARSKQTEIAQNVPDLASATSRLMGALNNIDSLERQSAKERSGAMADRDVGTTSAKRKCAKLVLSRNSDEVTAMMAPSAGFSAAMTPPPALSVGLKKADRAKAETSADQKLFDAEEAVPAGNSFRKDYSSPLKSKSTLAMSPSDIALLPPNVVTGISILRLGFSETQASHALAQLGTLKQQKVNNWTVISCQRPQDKGSTAVQLFMRNGRLLDAMRIFDSSLITPDFGVTMGENLSKVKEKFGEPAFILQEPGPGAGQNYIYPISQVGFQLARPAPGQQPRVVSVLIFNVK